MKLTDDQVMELKRKRSARVSLKALSSQYSISESMISRICSGERRSGKPRKRRERARNLTEAERHVIRKRRYSDGEKLCTIALDFNVAESTVSRIAPRSLQVW